MTGSERAGRILVTGSSNTDLVCQTDRLPGPGETVAASAFNIYAGGKAANQAVAAGRAGALVAFVGGFGGDAYGRDRRREMESEGIDLTHSRDFAGEPSGLALIAVDPGGENLIFTVGGANQRVTVDQFEPALETPRPDIVLLPNEAPRDVVRRALEDERGARVVLNAAPFEDYLRDLAHRVDVLICNEVEASQFLGLTVRVESALEAARELSGLCRGSAIITLGAAGAVGWADDAGHNVAALAVDVVDTTGAGDAFCGAFAAWLARGAAFDEALSAGAAAGSLAATRAGAQPSLPTRDEILRHSLR